MSFGKAVWKILPKMRDSQEWHYKASPKSEANWLILTMINYV